MSALFFIQLALSLLNSVLKSAQVGGLPAAVVESIQAAIAELAKVHGSEVTKGQLEGLKVETQW